MPFASGAAGRARVRKRGRGGGTTQESHKRTAPAAQNSKVRSALRKLQENLMHSNSSKKEDVAVDFEGDEEGNEKKKEEGQAEEGQAEEGQVEEHANKVPRTGRAPPSIVVVPHATKPASAVTSSSSSSSAPTQAAKATSSSAPTQAAKATSSSAPTQAAKATSSRASFSAAVQAASEAPASPARTSPMVSTAPMAATEFVHELRAAAACSAEGCESAAVMETAAHTGSRADALCVGHTQLCATHAAERALHHDGTVHCGACSRDCEMRQPRRPFPFPDYQAFLRRHALADVPADAPTERCTCGLGVPCTEEHVTQEDCVQSLRAIVRAVEEVGRRDAIVACALGRGLCATCATLLPFGETRHNCVTVMRDRLARVRQGKGPTSLLLGFAEAEVFTAVYGEGGGGGAGAGAGAAVPPSLSMQWLEQQETEIAAAAVSSPAAAVDRDVRCADCGLKHRRGGGAAAATRQQCLKQQQRVMARLYNLLTRDEQRSLLWDGHTDDACADCGCLADKNHKCELALMVRLLHVERVCQAVPSVRARIASAVTRARFSLGHRCDTAEVKETLRLLAVSSSSGARREQAAALQRHVSAALGLPAFSSRLTAASAESRSSQTFLGVVPTATPAPLASLRAPIIVSAAADLHAPPHMADCVDGLLHLRGAQAEEAEAELRDRNRVCGTATAAWAHDRCAKRPDTSGTTLKQIIAMVDAA